VEVLRVRFDMAQGEYPEIPMPKFRGEQVSGWNWCVGYNENHDPFEEDICFAQDNIRTYGDFDPVDSMWVRGFFELWWWMYWSLTAAIHTRVFLGFLFLGMRAILRCPRV